MAFLLTKLQQSRVEEITRQPIEGPVYGIIMALQGHLYILLGDHHTRMMPDLKCSSVPTRSILFTDLLHILLRSVSDIPSYQIDVFFEHFFIDQQRDLLHWPSEYYFGAPIYEFNAQFLECFGNRHRCDMYATTQFHYADIRFIDDRDLFYPIKLEFDQIISTPHFLSYFIRTVQIPPSFWREAVEFCLGLTNTPLNIAILPIDISHKEYLQILFTHLRTHILRQLKRAHHVPVEHERVRERASSEALYQAISLFFQNKIIELVTRMYDISNQIPGLAEAKIQGELYFTEFFLNVSYNSHQMQWKFLKNTFLLFYLMIMDIYLLSRMMRFHHSTRETWVYTGNAHTLVYVEFLRSIGAETIAESPLRFSPSGGGAFKCLRFLTS